MEQSFFGTPEARAALEDWRAQRDKSERTQRPPPRRLERDAPAGCDDYDRLPDSAYDDVQQGEPEAAPLFPFVAVGDLDYGPPEFLIHDLIETDTLGLLFGDPGCGKSFLAVDLAMSVASGAAFHGRAVRRGAVFYIAGEGHKGLARRFHAWNAHHFGDERFVPVFKSGRAAQFLDRSSAQAVAQSVRALAETHGAPALIIVDTLARNFGPGDENSTAEMNGFVAAMDDLRSQWPDCVLLIVHHSGHGEKQRARGAMALKGALDFEFRLERDDKALTLVNTKMKDAPEPDDMFFALHDVPLSKGGKSAVLIDSEAPVRAAKVSPTQRIALATYRSAALAGGVWDGGAFRGLHLEDWRVAFYSSHPGDTPEAKKKAFQRARKDLVDAGRMTVRDDVYLISDDAVLRDVMDTGTSGTKRDMSQPVPGQAGQMP